VLRLRPKIMTIVTMTASLLPLLWADGAAPSWAQGGPTPSTAAFYKQRSLAQSN
jgi:hypothetical protein